LLFTAINGKYTFAITANGYDPLETYFASREETDIEANINLDPAGNNAPLAAERALIAVARAAVLYR